MCMAIKIVGEKQVHVHIVIQDEINLNYLITI